MVSFTEIMNETDESKRNQMIQERLKELDTQAEQNYELKTNHIYHGFISSTSSVDFSDFLFMVGKDSPKRGSYTMTNQEYIIEFIEYIKKFKVNNNLNKIIPLISPFLKKYFGVKKDGNNKYDRETYFDNVTEILRKMEENNHPEYRERIKETFDIGFFKGKSMAECSEYAAITQNIFTFIGCNSYYVPGKLIMPDHQEEHAFNIVQTAKDKFFIFDTSNPDYAYDENFNIIGARTRFCPISQEQFEKVITEEGISQRFKISNYQTINGETKPIDEETWEYQTTGYKKGKTL